MEAPVIPEDRLQEFRDIVVGALEVYCSSYCMDNPKERALVAARLVTTFRSWK